MRREYVVPDIARVRTDAVTSYLTNSRDLDTDGLCIEDIRLINAALARMRRDGIPRPCDGSHVVHTQDVALHAGSEVMHNLFYSGVFGLVSLDVFIRPRNGIVAVSYAHRGIPKKVSDEVFARLEQILDR